MNGKEIVVNTSKRERGTNRKTAFFEKRHSKEKEGNGEK